MVSSDAQLFVCCAHLDFSHMLSPVKQAGQCLAHDCLALRAIVGPSCFASPPSGMLEAQTSFSNLTVLCLARIIHKESELMWPRPWLPRWSLPQKERQRGDVSAMLSRSHSLLVAALTRFNIEAFCLSLSDRPAVVQLLDHHDYTLLDD